MLHDPKKLERVQQLREAEEQEMARRGAEEQEMARREAEEQERARREAEEQEEARGGAEEQPVPVGVGHQGTVHDVGCTSLHKGECACSGLAPRPHLKLCCNAGYTCKEHREVRRLAARGSMAQLRKRQRM